MLLVLPMLYGVDIDYPSHKQRKINELLQVNSTNTGIEPPVGVTSELFFFFAFFYREREELRRLP